MTDVVIKTSEKRDTESLSLWFKEPGILSGFPMCNDTEVEDSIRLWSYHIDMGAGLTAWIGGERVGMLVLYINPFKKLAHTCLFSIVVNPAFRKRGVATLLIQTAEKVAKEKFGIEILHLEVYEKNEKAYRLYQKLGFIPYGKQKHFTKENGAYLDKVLMQKKLT